MTTTSQQIPPLTLNSTLVFRAKLLLGRQQISGKMLQMFVVYELNSWAGVTLVGMGSKRQLASEMGRKTLFMRGP